MSEVLIRKYGGARGTGRGPFRGTSKCVFCGASASKLTKEHVFSRWTHKYMRPRQTGRTESLRGVHYPGSDRSRQAVVKLPGELRDWQIRCVCGGDHTTCNGGWMKRLEDRARPFLIPLIRGDHTEADKIRLQPYALRIIAAWTALKVMVAEFDEGNHPITHHMQRRYMMRHSLAPAKNWGVWIGHFERQHWNPEWISIPFLVLPDSAAAKRPNRDATYFNGNSTTQVFNKLFIHVLHSPMPNLIERWGFALPEGGTLFRIWPPSDFGIMWPSTPLSDTDADFAAGAFARFLDDSLASRESAR